MARTPTLSIADAPPAAIRCDYEAWAQEYLRNLPPEHFMEATAQSTQRKITVASLELVTARRPDVHVFNELLVQYPRAGKRRPGQVVPDNMVVITSEPIEADLSYNTALEPAGPFWTLEYVSRGSKRKDYTDSFKKYQTELKVPYYLVFESSPPKLTVFHLVGKKYEPLKANRKGRLAIKELELEVALLDGWVRYWYQGELLPLPSEMLQELDEAKRQAEQANRRATQLQSDLDEEREARRVAEEELARLRAAMAADPTRSKNGIHAPK